ncbi:hypothetical protein HDU97_002735 [Phlyctochytrium planicorne]|nr:hypothetical protein HDU97_002735 [Phlyctochytrium planicorne]
MGITTVIADSAADSQRPAATKNVKAASHEDAEVMFSVDSDDDEDVDLVPSVTTPSATSNFAAKQSMSRKPSLTPSHLSTSTSHLQDRKHAAFGPLLSTSFIPPSMASARSPSPLPPSSASADPSASTGQQPPQELEEDIPILITYDDLPSIITSATISHDRKRSLITQTFIRACSNGDLGLVCEMLGVPVSPGDGTGSDTSSIDGSSPSPTMPTTKGVKEWIDINGRDEDGGTALVYAACWGHADIVELVLGAGANVDDGDQNGWTPLLWACSNNHPDTALLLLRAGASRDVKSNRGRSVNDILKRGASSEIRKVLSMDPTSTSTFSSEDTPTPSQFFAPSPPVSPPSSPYMPATTSSSSEEESDSDAEEDTIPSTPFDFENCTVDQMLVFSPPQIDRILEVALAVPKAGKKKKNVKPVMANILFLCARYAVHWHSKELMEEFLGRAIRCIVGDIQKSPTSTHLHLHHLTNITLLLRYLRRDPSLRSATTDLQATFTELIREIHSLICFTLTHQITPIAIRSILEHTSESPSQNYPRMEGTFSALGRRRTVLTEKNTASITKTPPESPSQRPRSWLPTSPKFTATPKTLLTLLDTHLDLLQTSHLHPTLVTQTLIHILHTVTSTLINTFLTTKHLHSRHRASQIRVNLSTLEDWICRTQESLQTTLLPTLTPLIHLTKFVQLATTLQDLQDLLLTLSSLPSITPPMLSILLRTYKYEKNEPSFPEELEFYTLKLIEDLTRATPEEDRERVLSATVDAGRLIPPLTLPPMSGTDADEGYVGDGWMELRPFVPERVMGLLDGDRSVEEELGVGGWDGGI